MKKIVLVLLSLIVFTGCKKQGELADKVVVKEVVEPSILSVDIEFNTDQLDKFQFLFSQIELKSNQDAVFIINDNINASVDFQNKKYEMFADLIPLIVQFKLGTKPKKMIINKVLITYEDQEVIVNGEDLDKYFFLNDNIDFDAPTKTITTKSINGSHHPHMTLKRGFINKLFELE